MGASPRLAVLPAPRPSLELRQEQTPPKQKFDAEFIERRMRQHRQMMRELEDQWTYQIIREVLAATEVSRGRTH
jgi:hypothetical protein